MIFFRKFFTKTFRQSLYQNRSSGLWNLFAIFRTNLLAHMQLRILHSSVGAKSHQKSSQRPLNYSIGTGSQGQHYDLEQIYSELNQAYFANKLKLKITWSGQASRQARVRRRLGAYHPHLKLIKIHRLLDHPQFPPYFISFVVYHEMLHHVCPPKKKLGRRRQIHHAEFKRREKEFQHFALAKEWEKEQKHSFFTKIF